MKKILCPTDFSDAANNAVAYAAKLSKATGADLTLFHVQSVFETTPEEILRGKPLASQAMATQLDAQSREISQTFRISCYAEVMPSGRGLAKVIRDRGKEFDLIVMGSNGPDDYYQFFAGSNTFNVIKQALVPVLMVPDGYLYSEIKLIVYAFDYLRERMLPLDQLLPWIGLLKCNLSVLQVIEEAHSKEVDLTIKAIQKLVRKHYEGEIVLNFDTIRSSDVAGSINSYMIKNQADLLALCTQHHGFLGGIFHRSVVKKLSAAAASPLLLLHS
jgi:nucleotide-binding universal stress UspA family protein